MHFCVWCVCVSVRGTKKEIRMAGMQEGNIYARSEILQWVAEILQTEYGSFRDIAARDIAVLLYAIFNSVCKDGAVDHGVADVVSLHDIQFCDNPTSMTCFLNAKRVLSMVQTLSSHTPETNGEADSGGVNGGRRVVPSAVGNMTVSAWMEGKAFVEELKMWRWIRAQAFQRGLDKQELARRVQAFLHGTEHHADAPPSSAVTTATATGCGRDAEKKLTGDTRDSAGGAGDTRPNKRSREGDEKTSHVAESASAAPGGKNDMRRKNATDARPKSETEGGEAAAPVAQPRVDTSGEPEGPTPPLPHVMCDALVAAPRLLGVLEEVRRELEERRVAAGSSGATTAAGSSAGRGSEPHTTDDTRGSGRSFTGCSCPAVFAEVVQQNYNAIERLEAARKRAVAACLKRDASGLLEALAFI